MAQKKLHRLEALRGFASLFVVLHHSYIFKDFWQTPLTKFLFFGQEAVMLFFILSGFVIQYSFLLSGDKSFKTYFFKRFNRIYIPLIIVLLANIIIFYIENKPIIFDFKELVGNIFMLQDMDWRPRIICAPILNNNPLWSLSYEWWFYMSFFVFHSYFNSKTTKYIYYIGVVATISYLVYPFWLNRLLMYLMLWNLGASFANCYMEGKQINFKTMFYPLLYITAAAALLAVNFVINKEKVHELINFKGTVGIGVSPLLELRGFVVTLLLASIAILWHNFKWKGFNYSIGVFEFIAPVSYCFYISHFFMITKASYLKFIDNDIVEEFLYFSICLAFCYVVERIIYPKVNKLIMSKVAPKKIIA